MHKRRLILLAHPDDELMALHFILNDDFETFIIYLSEEKSNSFRSIEAKKAIAILNHKGARVTVLETPAAMSDSLMHHELTRYTVNKYLKFAKTLFLSEILTTSYEGGHQDHDTAFILSFIIASSLKVPLFEFTTYRLGGMLPFKVLHKLPQAVPIRFNPLKVSSTFLRLTFIYKSQWKTWIGLGPFVFIKYARGYLSSTSAVNEFKLVDDSSPFYELRGRATAKEVNLRHREILTKYLSNK